MTDNSTSANPAHSDAGLREDELLALKKKPRNYKKIIIPTVALVLAVGLLVLFLTRGGAGNAAVAMEYQMHTVGRRDIVSMLSGSGTLQPADSYTVTGLVSGEILEAPFEEGDEIRKGALLYRIDPSDAEQAIKTAQSNLDAAQDSLDRALRNYQDLLEERSEHERDRAKDRAELTLNAKISGQVTKLYVEAGDTVAAGTVIADVQDSSTMLLTLPFIADEAAGIRAGDSAQVTISGTGELLGGTIDSVSNVTYTSALGVPVRDVVIAVRNPGGLAAGASATAETGGAACHAQGVFSYSADGTIKATKGGEIASLYIDEGGLVTEGQRVLTLSETEDAVDYDKQLSSAQDSIRDAERTLESRRDSLESAREALGDYEITSPIDGTVIEKTFKAGDTVSAAGNASGGMATIYDLSSLSFVMDVDELDISLIREGQTVSITADAAEGRIYEGIVTRISVKGTSANGVTSYPVTIELTETDGLLPGMNVSAEILISQSENTLAIPAGALQRGNRVLKQTAPGADPNAELPEGSMIPEGFEYMQVVVGETDGDYIEILEGLEEGDVIAYVTVSGSEGNIGDFTGFPGGGMGGFVVEGENDSFEFSAVAPAGAAPAGGRP